MRFPNNLCKPSATISAVPIGLPLKLQYNQFGILQNFSVGLSIDLDPMYEDSDAGQFDHNKLFDAIKKFVPGSIGTQGGTTWVYGVLYTDRIPCDEGMMPQALFKSYIKDILNGGVYVFYAGYVYSLAVSFVGPVVVRNFLSTNRFNALPQIIVPLTITDDTIKMLMKNSSAGFKEEFIAGFFIFEDTNCRYAEMKLLQVEVKNDVKPFVDADGFLKGEIQTLSGRSYVLNYSSIVRHGVSKGCSLLVERNSEDRESSINILATRAGIGIDKVIDNLGKDIKCPVCGKLYRVGYSDAPVECDDPHCLSHEFNNANRMLTKLGFPAISFNSYYALVDSKTIICLTDLLELPPCTDEEINVSMATALSAAIPGYIVPEFSILERFANKCNNNVETAVYYINNPIRIETDFDLIDTSAKKLVKWLEDPYNASTVTTVFDHVKIESKIQKFDGDPIFRGNTFALTGKFKRGDYPEIKSILSSYAANIIPSIDPGERLPDVVITGSTNEEISGQMIQKARIHSIPIVEEDDFFRKYEIDDDLARNLL